MTPTIIYTLVSAALIGLIPAVIAAKKGRNFIGWWVYGTLLFIVAIIHSILIDRIDAPGTTRECPYCAETIKAKATVCRFCGREVPQPSPSDTNAQTNSSDTAVLVILILTFAVAAGLSTYLTFK